MAELAPRSTPLPIDRSRLDAVVDPIARAHGAEVVDVEYKNDQGGWVLRVFVEKLGAAENNSSTEDAAVALSLCSDIAKELSPALDAVDVIPNRYHLEISSPGVERTLRGARDFARFIGKKAKLKVHNSVKGQKVLIGILGPIKGELLSLDDGNQTYEIALDNVSAARLVFEFGPQPKPGKPGSKKKSK